MHSRDNGGKPGRTYSYPVYVLSADCSRGSALHCVLCLSPNGSSLRHSLWNARPVIAFRMDCQLRYHIFRNMSRAIFISNHQIDGINIRKYVTEFWIICIRFGGGEIFPLQFPSIPTIIKRNTSMNELRGWVMQQLAAIGSIAALAVFFIFFSHGFFSFGFFGFGKRKSVMDQAPPVRRSIR